MAAEAYCVKCKTKREMKDATQIQMKNGRPATEGKCPVCGTKMFKIGAASSRAPWEFGQRLVEFYLVRDHYMLWSVLPRGPRPDLSHLP